MGYQYLSIHMNKARRCLFEFSHGIRSRDFEQINKVLPKVQATLPNGAHQSLQLPNV
jgi:hypothetical protein